jgi:hypothetical protein
MAIIGGSCHCGATRFEVLGEVTEATACTCTICSKRGALWSYHKPAQFRLLTPRENLSTYRWQSRMVAHHFCGRCGCTTFTESPDWSSGEPDFDNPQVAVNARVLDDFDLAAVPVTVIDGRNLW